MNRRLAIHTDAPLMPLTQMVGDTATIEVGKAPKTGGPDCIYGWAEPKFEWPESGVFCPDHHIIVGLDDEEVKWMARTLATLGHQVIVTEPTLFTEPTGDHEIAEDMPEHYDWKHHH
jgi:hypothetical protein